MLHEKLHTGQDCPQSSAASLPQLLGQLPDSILMLEILCAWIRSSASGPSGTAISLILKHPFYWYMFTDLDSYH